MGNMSYCRFHNTSIDLDDCEEALFNEDPLSPSEIRSAKDLIQSCIRIAEEFGDVDLDEHFENLIDE